MEPLYGNRAAFLLVITPLLLPFLLIAVLGVDMLLWDEFFYADFVKTVREGGDWLPWLWLQHNEHRVVATKLVMIPNALFLGWSRIAEMYVSAVLCTLVVLGLWRLYRRSGGSDLLLFAPVAWLACSLAQYENLLYGLMTCHWFTVLGIVWALVCLDRPGLGSFAAAVFFGVLASFSILNGFLVWPAGLFLLLARGRRPMASAAWLVAGLAAVALYLIGFQLPGGPTPLSLAVIATARTGLYALVSLGAPLAGGSVAWGLAVGGLLIALAAATVFGWWQSGRARLREEALPAALFLFGLLSCAMISAGRAALGTPLQPRYISYSSLAVIGGYLLVCQSLWRRGGTLATSPRFTAVLGLLATGIAAASLDGIDRARDWRLARLQERFLAQTADQQRDQDLTSLYFVPQLRKSVPYLRDERLGPFADPQELLLLVRWKEGTPLGEILPGRAVEQTLVCPVEELHDVGVPFALYGRANTSRLLLTVESGGRRLAARTLSASGLSENAWVEVPLDEPLRGCRGRTLRIRAESPDALPGNAVTLWSYPPYYRGRLRQGGVPLPGRALGVMLNGFHAGLQ